MVAAHSKYGSCTTPGRVGYLQAVEEYSCSVARPAGQSWHGLHTAHCTLHTAMSDDDATAGDAARLFSLMTGFASAVCGP